MSNQKVMVLGGINVVAVDSDSRSCSGCCFDHLRTADGVCTIVEKCLDVIYKKVEDMEQKFTLDEFVDTYNKCFPHKNMSFFEIQKLKKFVEKSSDPEYKEFLRLKEKFQE